MKIETDRPGLLDWQLQECDITFTLFHLQIVEQVLFSNIDIGWKIHKTQNLSRSHFSKLSTVIFLRAL